MSTNLLQDIKNVHRQINDLDASERYRMQPRLAGLLGQLREARQPIPSELRRLNDELLAEAIEAQFDNLPV